MKKIELTNKRKGEDDRAERDSHLNLPLEERKTTSQSESTDVRSPIDTVKKITDNNPTSEMPAASIAPYISSEHHTKHKRR